MKYIKNLFFVVVFTFLILVSTTLAISPAPVSTTFLYTFNSPGVLETSTYIQNTTSPYFWVSSGGRMVIKDDVGETIQGPLAVNDPERLNYSVVNPLDTYNGYYPQNTFRLVTRSYWGDSEEQVSFKINKTNLTDTPNRDGYSGIFLFSRYSDKDDLYYAGIRQDGLAVIKKKIGGTYYTLDYRQFFGTPGDYNKYTNPNLIPQNKWMGLKVKTTNNADGSVRIELLFDADNSGVWKSLLTYTDRNTGGDPYLSSGHGGIRTDYMDVMFDNFKIKTL